MVKIDLKDFARKIILSESVAVKKQISSVDYNFITAVNVLASLTGKVIVLGVGKSGLIGRKIAATFSSVGVPSVFLSPVELMHGNFGVIVPGDIVLIVSFSGETEEIKKIVPFIKKTGNKIIALSGRKNSSLAKNSDIFINVDVKKEACPYDLIPTSSTTATLALGDALALSVGMIKGFKREDLLKFHPAGTTAQKIKLKVKDLMRTGKNNPIVFENEPVKKALVIMTTTKLGATSVIDKNKKLAGYFTDGDLRRGLQKYKNFLNLKLRHVMTRNPKVIFPDDSALNAAKMMQKYKCDNLPVINSRGEPVGIIDERDLISVGLI